MVLIGMIIQKSLHVTLLKTMMKIVIIFSSYLLEVDIEYPEFLHEAHRDLPFLPIKKKNLLHLMANKAN